MVTESLALGASQHILGEHILAEENTSPGARIRMNADSCRYKSVQVRVWLMVDGEYELLLVRVVIKLNGLKKQVQGITVKFINANLYKPWWLEDIAVDRAIIDLSKKSLDFFRNS